MKNKIMLAGVISSITAFASPAFADNPPCTSDLEKETQCISSEGINSYHNGSGVILTAEVVGQAQAGVSRAVRGANNLQDGRANMEAILANEDASLAAKKCTSLGEDWYLPAARELRSLYLNTVGSDRHNPLNNRMLITSTFQSDAFGGQSIAVVDATSNAILPGISNQGLMRNNNEYDIVCAKHID